MLDKLHHYIETFNKNDEEIYVQSIPNKNAERFLSEEIPLLDCPDKELEEIYYFRWWTFRKHVKHTEKGYIITEFLPNVPWSGPYNSINCPACFHIREGRWLKDSLGIVKNYINFWLNGSGDLHVYSAWYAHAVLEYCQIKNDYAYAVEKLPELINFFETREKKSKRHGGIYWSHDGYDGMEYSISGVGLRPTINSYAYADALAISKIAALAGEKEIEARFQKKANQIKQITDKLLWDKDFYKTIPISEDCVEIPTTRPKVVKANDAKELVGFVPWYFNIPEQGKEIAFKELLNEKGFKAKFGLTTAEQRHFRFFEEFKHECLWNGPVWPFATSQVLVALSNLIRNYSQTVINKSDYYRILLQYAKSQHITKEDGKTVPWIDENLHPYTGEWIVRERLKASGWPEKHGGYERGKDYNHSLFCDLVLSGLLGISVENGEFKTTPIIPDDWKYFRVDNLWLNGKRYRIIFDKDGTRYGMGEGLSVSEY